MKKENPKAFKHFISTKTAESYFGHLDLPKSELQRIQQELVALELKDRVRLIARELKEALPKDYPKALRALLKLTHAQKLTAFELWPATEFIQQYGLEYVDDSLAALKELTQKFTAEFAIRPFINRYGIEIYQRLMRLQKDPSEHTRRWLSEGTRPRLPWGEKLNLALQDPSHGLAILEALKFDSSLYVRKSVANHLNDISKDHPARVIQTLKAWKKDIPPAFDNEFNFIVHRALRTLIKNGDPAAMKLMGVDVKDEGLKLANFKLSHSSRKIGETIELSLTIKNSSTKAKNFILDYNIEYQRKGEGRAKKVFKLKKGVIPALSQLKVLKLHSFKDVSIRKHHPGKHLVSLQLNGKQIGTLAVQLRG